MALIVLPACSAVFSVVRQAVFGIPLTSLYSEEDGLSSSFVLDVGGEALKELGIFSLGHSSED